MAGPKKAERKPVSPLPATWLPDVLAGSPAPRVPAASPVASPGPAAPVAGDVAFIRRVLAARAPAALAEVDAAHVVAGRGEADLVAWLARPIARTEVTDPLQAALDGLGTINALVGQISPTDRRAATFLTALSNLSKTVENIAKNRPREPTRNEVEERIAGRAVEARKKIEEYTDKAHAKLTADRGELAAWARENLGPMIAAELDRRLSAMLGEATA